MSVTQQKRYEKLLLILFTVDFQPLSIVEHRGFGDFVHALNPGYILLSRKVISKTLMSAEYEQCLNIIKNKLKSVF